MTRFEIDWLEIRDSTLSRRFVLRATEASCETMVFLNATTANCRRRRELDAEFTSKRLEPRHRTMALRANRKEAPCRLSERRTNTAAVARSVLALALTIIIIINNNKIIKLN